MKSKKEFAHDKLESWASKFRCPICQTDIKINHGQMFCEKSHTFDLAKQGYLNLLPNHHEEHYDKSLFESRYDLMNKGKFYRGLYGQVQQLLEENNLIDEEQFILDLGTGEGTHLSMLRDKLTGSQAMGLDIAKEGIQTAAKHYTNALWVIGDLGNIPLKDASLTGALTILTPSNYEETNRVLKKDGWFIKIIPGENYLKELRAIILTEEKVAHNPQLSIERFDANFDLIQQSRFDRIHSLNNQDRENLLQMTPLMWNATEEQIEQAQKLETITVDLILLLGKNRSTPK